MGARPLKRALQSVVEDALAEEILKGNIKAGNKVNASMFEVADIYKTSVCPLAQVMRKELKKRNIKDVKVVYSKEQALKPLENNEEITNKRALAGSTAFVPPVVGFIIAAEVIRDLLKI